MTTILAKDHTNLYVWPIAINFVGGGDYTVTLHTGLDDHKNV